ncbi:MAG TPA: HU family DNA-binding protein [Alphaproteobacteria bacterium]
MNKTELVAAVAKKTDLSKSKAEEALNALLDAITASLKKGNEVKLIGFGTFKVSNRKAQMGRNPRTGEPLKISASKQPKFAAGKALKDAVNKRA